VQKTENAGTWNAWGESDPGKKRENNEDRILCDPDHGIFVVVDGMGGEAAGEVAAQQAVDFIGAPQVDLLVEGLADHVPDLLGFPRKDLHGHLAPFLALLIPVTHVFLFSDRSRRRTRLGFAEP